MKTVNPPSLTNTADGSEFLILSSWINNMELLEAMIVSMF
jgi:hypothetical protein